MGHIYLISGHLNLVYDYIVNNIINHGLIWVLLNKQYNINKDDYEEAFAMNIIDNKAKIIQLNNKQSIQILETEYSIIDG